MSAIMPLKKVKGYIVFAIISFVLLFVKVVIHLHFCFLPLLFFGLGIISYYFKGKKAIFLFLFLLPLINSSPDLFFNGYPFNYMAVILFYLAGIICASWLLQEKNLAEFPGSGVYIWFLTLMFISFFFVFLRWSNLTLSWLAFLRDTPVIPAGQRLSFASIFPVVTLALFSLTPFLLFFIRRYELREEEIFMPLRVGFCLSFIIALLQRWVAADFLAQSWWVLNLKQVNGGFSDFNAFGFFSGVLFLYQFLRIIRKLSSTDNTASMLFFQSPKTYFSSLEWKWWLPELFFLLLALAAIFLSGCRTAFLFVLLALFYLIFFVKKISFMPKIAIIFLLGVSLLLTGGTMKHRLEQTFIQVKQLFNHVDQSEVVNQLSNARLLMLKDSMRMIGRFPVSGIGVGNFLFYLKFLHYGESFYEDLALNQYLLIATETGLIGSALFILFLGLLLKRQRQGSVRFILAAIMLTLMFNNFLWFPEVLLLFWIFVACAEPIPSSKHYRWGRFGLVLILIFIFCNIVDFSDLHPMKWANLKGTAYDYGFWTAERDKNGLFSWTGNAAGKFITADMSRDFMIANGAPAAVFRDKGMDVRLFWQGKPYKQVIFRDKQVKEFHLPYQQAGFLEIRVLPTFNMKSLGLSPDSRDLGVQFYGQEKLP